MRLGIGLGISEDPARSARDAARQAKKTCPKPTLALAFGSIRLDQRKIHAALCRELDASILLGGSSFGEITTAGATKGTVAVLLVELDGAAIRFADASAAKGSASAGAELARLLGRGPADGAIALGLLFSAISDFEGNSGLDALRAKLGCLPFFGGMTGSDYDLGLSHPDFRLSYQYGAKLTKDAARLALLELPADAHRVSFGFEHGWSPVGPISTLTRCERNKVFEVDGMPVLDYYRQFLCDEEGQRFFELGIQRFAFALQLEGEYEGSSLIKLPVVCDFKEGTVQYNPADDLQGRRVRLVLGSRTGLVDGARRAAQRCRAALGGADPALVLAVSCCTRASILHSRMGLEVAAVREVFGPRVPVFGCYAGGEIAPFLSRYEDAMNGGLKFSGSYHHATTIVLLALGATKRASRVAMPRAWADCGETLRAENDRLKEWLSKGEAVLDDHEAFLASLSRKSYEDGEKLAKQTDIIRRYTPHEVWKEIGANAERGEYELADCHVTAGFLFMDVKGYTSFSESHSPAEIVAALNGIFEPATRLVYECGGDVDKYIGDALFASFRRPEDAVAAAARLLALVAENARAGSPFTVRVGVNAGRAVRANVGSATRREYTFVGDAVNTAQRLEANCEPGHALIGADLEKAARKTFTSVIRRELTVKGKTTPVVAFDCSF